MGDHRAALPVAREGALQLSDRSLGGQKTTRVQFPSGHDHLGLDRHCLARRGCRRARSILRRALQRGSHFTELRSQAYVDFVRAVSAIAIGGRDQAPLTAADALADLTDAKVRIALCGSGRVLHALAAFCRTDQRLTSNLATEAFLELAAAMRQDASGRTDAKDAKRELSTIFFQQ